MKSTNIISVQSNSATVPCPIDEEIRIVSVDVIMSGPSVQFDSAIFAISRGGQTLVTACTNPMGSNIGEICAGIGSDLTSEQATNVDPATGNVTLSASQKATLALPDVWWPFDVVVTVGATVAPASMNIVYESRPRDVQAAKAKARKATERR